MLKDYWNMHHTKHLKDNSKVKMLTGTQLVKYCELFNLTMEYLKDQKILEIGVGTGDATKQMSLIANIDALDISDVAIDKVSKFISVGYTDPLALPQNTYDVVISNLVAQHMSTEDLREQLLFVIRSLKLTGTMYMQFAEANGYNPETIEVQQGGGVLHSVQDMDNIVDSVGGIMKLIQTIQILPNVKWHCIAIRRK